MSSKPALLKVSIYLLAGTIFGFGLALSGMTDPKVVTGFLDLFGDWNMSLIFVMVAGIAVTSIGYRLIFRSEQPVFDQQFFIPEYKTVDKPLILGASIFGLGGAYMVFARAPRWRHSLRFIHKL